MREFKFKAYSESLKKFSKPFTFGQVLNFTNENGLGVIKSLENEIVVQFIGLSDKEGQEIYNGHILQEDCPRGNRYLVFRVAGGFAVNMHQDDLNKSDIIFYESTADMQTSSYLSGSCTIIGNRFEHPELLK